MIRTALEWLATKLPAPRVIYDRDGVSQYLSRYYLWGAPIAPDDGSAFDETGNPRKGVQWHDGIGVFLHRFHRSDADPELHNHPWRWGVSLILAGGYIEERREGLDVVTREFEPGSVNLLFDSTFHRVELHRGEAWSLFVAGPRAQSWGFWDRSSGLYTPWREFIEVRREQERALREEFEALRGTYGAQFAAFREAIASAVMVAQGIRVGR